MAQNLMQESTFEDEIDLLDLIKILTKSKKLIISSILIFSIVGYIFSLSLNNSYTTSTQIEIGYYERPDGTSKLIEKSSDIVSDLKILVLRNPDKLFSQNISIESIENKVISIETTSTSVEQNEKIINQFISYILKKHSKIIELNTNGQHNKTKDTISLVQDAITSGEKMIQDNPDADLQDQMNMLNGLFGLKKELTTLKNKLKIAESQSYKMTQTFGGLKTITNEPKIVVNLFLSLIFGLITGVVLALIRNFVKSYKESKA